MTDRELLEAAAKAGGVPIGAWYAYSNAFYCAGERAEWNPLTDDGDAMRLAVALALYIEIDAQHDERRIRIYGDWSDDDARIIEPFGEDPYAATRRAIVRAAAALAEPPKESR